VPARPTYPNAQASQQIPQQVTPQMVFMSGNVVRDDGSPPPYGAVIELDCGGSVTREAIVGLNGRFSFELGGDNRFSQVFPDASQNLGSYTDDMDGGIRGGFDSGFPSSTARRYRRVIGCEIRAQLPGFRSTSVYIKEEPMSGSNELGTLVVYPRDRVLGSMVSLTNLLAPKEAKKSVEQGQKAVRKEKIAEAEAHFKSAVQVYPKYAEAWYSLGLIYEHTKRADQAAEAYRQAVLADGLYVRPYLRLASLAYERKDWSEAAAQAEKVITLDPVTMVESYYISALANLNVGNLEIADKRARQGQKIDFSQRFPQFHLILANVFILRQDSAGTVRELKSYLKSAPDATNAALVRSRLQALEEQMSAGGR
jgi:tetratricopeptide (TPR) repeat protein